MANYKFYTPPLLAERLISLLPKRQYNSVIDICCGSWNLLNAARRRYDNASYTGVDVDIEAKKCCFKEAKFFCEDGRSFAIKKKNRNSLYDLILSNPPFGYLQDDNRFFKEKSNLEIVDGLNNKRYENEMIQANLLLAKRDGVLLFILPATFVEGESNIKVRRELSKRYTIDSIVKLPIETFGSSKINTYAMILINSFPQIKRTELKEILLLNESWIVKKIDNISVKNIQDGIWNNKKNIKSRNNNAILFRGNISSAQFDDKGVKVYHSSSDLSSGVWKPSIRYCSNEECIKKSRVALPGDIIVNRVGRFTSYWCLNTEKGIVSDCLIVIRPKEGYNIYEMLLQNSIKGKLNIATKGVSIKYITMSDILEVI